MTEGTRLLQIVQEAHPDLAIETVEERHGQFNDILIADDRFVFRFPRSESARETLSHEIAVLRAIRDRVSLSVPDPSLSSDDPAGVPLFMGYELIPGRGLTYADLNATNRETIAGQLAGFLQELHAVPLDALPKDMEIGELPASWASFYRDVCDHLFPHMREETRGRVARQFEAYFEDPHRYSFDTCLRHGDFGTGNILWDPEEVRVTGIIDFGSCRPGDPAQDLGAALVSFGSALCEEMYRHYPELKSMYDRAVFYTGTYALKQAIDALHDGDDQMFEAGIARFR